MVLVEAIESSVVSRLVSRLDKDDIEDELVSRLVVDDVSFRSVDKRELKVVNSFAVLISGLKLVVVDVVEVIVEDADVDDDDRKGAVVEVIIPLFPHKPKLKSVISFKL